MLDWIGSYKAASQQHMERETNKLEHYKLEHNYNN